MLVYDKAHELADEIKKNADYIEYARLKEIVTADAQTKSLLAGYKKLQLEAQASYLTGKEPDAETMGPSSKSSVRFWRSTRTLRRTLPPNISSRRSSATCTALSATHATWGWIS